MMNADDLELQNQDGNTAFCIAAISGHVDMVKIMFEKNEALTKICGSENMMPLTQVAFHGNVPMMSHLYYMSDEMGDWENDKKIEVLLRSIQCNVFGNQGLLTRKLFCVLSTTNLCLILVAFSQNCYSLYQLITKPFVGLSIRILEDNEQLPENKHAWDLLQALAVKPDTFKNESPRQSILMESRKHPSMTIQHLLM
ncbi:putative ankyrin repeat-containing domain-containing protein [Helianthus annuus]|nr:putative ankyrin repeat-containing domain-containing protein [Helianthus annuus]